MLTRLFLIFVLVPLADLILLLMLARIDWRITVLAILISGIVGAFYVRRQGISVMRQLRATLDRNEMPTDVLIEGALVLFASALLITPGLITDLFGFSLLLRPCRRWYQKQLIRWLKSRINVKMVVSPESGFRQKPYADKDIVDGEVVGRTDAKQDAQ